jgi:hypothetical protein
MKVDREEDPEFDVTLKVAKLELGKATVHAVVDGCEIKRMSERR